MQDNEPGHGQSRQCRQEKGQERSPVAEEPTRRRGRIKYPKADQAMQRDRDFFIIYDLLYQLYLDAIDSKASLSSGKERGLFPPGARACTQACKRPGLALPDGCDKLET